MCVHAKGLASVERHREACQLWTGFNCVFNGVAGRLKLLETAIQRKER